MRASASRPWSVVATLALGLTLTACGGKVDSAGSRFVFVSNSNSDTIAAFAVNADGSLKALQSSATGTTPAAMSADPTGRLLYVANSASDSVSAFAVPDNGFLASIGTFPAGASPQAVLVHPSGRFVYVANGGGNSVSAYRINAAGGLDNVGQPTGVGLFPDALAATPSGRFLFVAHGTTQDVRSFVVDNTTGQLALRGTFVDNGAFLPHPVALAMHPAGTFVYAINQNTQSISAFSINATTGALSVVPGSPFTSGSSLPTAVAVDNVANALYVAHQDGAGTVARHVILDNGALRLDQSGLFTVNNSAALVDLGSVALDPARKFLYAAEAVPFGINVHGFSVSDNGALAELPFSPVADAQGPSAIVIIRK